MEKQNFSSLPFNTALQIVIPTNNILDRNCYETQRMTAPILKNFQN